MSERTAKSYYEVEARDLPLHCPMPGQVLSHPRVYLPIKEAGGEVSCPYCGARYRLKGQ